MIVTQSLCSKHNDLAISIMMSDSEYLFTQEELEAIKEEAIMNPRLKSPSYLGIGNKKTALIRISPQNELLLAHGNEYTGNEHIRKRHSWYSGIPHWQPYLDKQGVSSLRLDDPSKFPAEIAPIQYSQVADAVYSSATKHDDINKRPDLFDVFCGTYNTQPYRLLLYKNTKVIHTLFPENKIHNSKRVKGFRFVRGNVSTSKNMASGEATATIPYYDHQFIVRYSLIFKWIPATTLLQTIVWAHDELGAKKYYAIVATEPFTGKVPMPNLMSLIQYADLRNWESWLKRVHEDLYNSDK